MHARSAAVLLVLFSAPGVRAQRTSDPLLLRPVRYDLTVGVDFGTQRLTGSARIQLRNENDRPVTEASLILYRLMAVTVARDGGGRALPFRQEVVAFEDFGKLQVNHVTIPLEPAVLPHETRTIEVEYAGYLLGYAETGMLYVRDHVDSAYTLVRDDAHAYPTVGYPSLAVQRRAGLPVFDYTARIRVPTTHTVANGGELQERREDGATVTYVYRSVKPSWRMDFAIAPLRTLRRGDLTVFHLPEDSAGASRIMGAITRTLALYTRWFGPLQGRSPFAVIEIPDGWGSQADVTSILQSAAAFRDPKRETELYHELAHLWSPPSTDRPSPRWDEGLATFLEDVTLDSLTGRETTDSNAVRVARWLAGRAATDSQLRTVPPASYGAREMTGNSYWVGSAMFYVLYRVVGHDTFTGIVGDYYRTYATRGGSTADFVRLAKARSSVDLTRLFDDWLYSTGWTRVVRDATTAGELYARYRGA